MRPAIFHLTRKTSHSHAMKTHRFIFSNYNLLDNEARNLEEYEKGQKTFISQSSNLDASKSKELGFNLEWPIVKWCSG